MKNIIITVLFFTSLSNCFAGQVQLDPRSQNITFRQVDDPRLSRYDHLTEIRVGVPPRSYTILELHHARYSAEERGNIEAIFERAQTEGKLIQIDYSGDFDSPIISAINLVERNTVVELQREQLSECQEDVELSENLLSNNATNTRHNDQINIDLSTLSNELLR